MKSYRFPVKLVVCAALVVSTFGLTPSYGQGRKLTKGQIDAIVSPSLSQCTSTANTTQNARLDRNTIIPSANTVAVSVDRITSTMNGMWHGQIIGSPLDVKYDQSKEGNVDYFWIIDTANAEGLIIALRDGNNSTAGMSLGVANPPQLSYLICAHEGYIPNVEKGSEIHQFTKVSNSVANAAAVLTKATGVPLTSGSTLTDMWQTIVASGYFQSLPAVAFAGGHFKPMQISLVPSSTGADQVSMSWNAEYYGGGTTWIKFTPGVPMIGTEYTQFVVTSGTNGDYLVASAGNGQLAKVEALEGGDYDLAFDSATLGPLDTTTAVASPSSAPAQKRKANHRTGSRKFNHGRRSK